MARKTSIITPICFAIFAVALGMAIGSAAAAGLGPSGPNIATPKASSWVWQTWSPSDTAGTATAPSSDTAEASKDASGYISQGASSGVLTLTFTKAGTYLVTVDMVGSYEGGGVATTGSTYIRVTLGGTATRYIKGALDPSYYLNQTAGSTGLQQNGVLSFLVVATAGQTLTVAPAIVVTSSGTASNNSAGCSVAAVYISA